MTPVEQLQRLVLRHGEDAVLDCVGAACDLAATHTPDDVRALAQRAARGGLVPKTDTAEAPAQGGRPSVPDSGLIAIWASVEALRQDRGLSVNAACKTLCADGGTRRHPIPGGISLVPEDGQPWRWSGVDNLRALHRKAQQRRKTDADFAAISDMILPTVREHLSA